MKKRFFVFGLCAVFILCTSGTALAKLFIVDIDGQRVVVDFWVDDEQAWQYSVVGDPGWWDGLAPHPYDFKIWYPYLEDTFDMTLKQQKAWIYRLKYAGIQIWRIAYFWDTIPLKASMFGSLNLGMNQRLDFNSDVYFCHTSEANFFGSILHQTHGRTGDELGNPALGGNGAIIEASGGFNFDDFDLNDDLNYGAWGTPVVGKPGSFYTLVPTHGQDHYWYWPNGGFGNPLPFHMYDDDINCSPDYLNYVIQAGDNPMGAWTLSESMPEIWPPKGQFHEIKISDVVHPAGDLIPVAIVSVMQDEPVFKTRSRVDYMKTSPDAIVDTSDEAAIVYLRAERSRSRREDGRVYHITFEDMDGNTFTLKIGVPKVREYKWSILVDGGPLYDSTVIE